MIFDSRARQGILNLRKYRIVSCPKFLSDVQKTRGLGPGQFFEIKIGDVFVARAEGSNSPSFATVVDDPKYPTYTFLGFFLDGFGIELIPES